MDFKLCFTMAGEHDCSCGHEEEYYGDLSGAIERAKVIEIENPTENGVSIYSGEESLVTVKGGEVSK